VWEKTADPAKVEVCLLSAPLACLGVCASQCSPAFGVSLSSSKTISQGAAPGTGYWESLLAEELKKMEEGAVSIVLSAFALSCFHDAVVVLTGPFEDERRKLDAYGKGYEL
jgi:hypothetical protein